MSAPKFDECYCRCQDKKDLRKGLRPSIILTRSDAPNVKREGI
jgi:hypothetical protein